MNIWTSRLCTLFLIILPLIAVWILGKKAGRSARFCVVALVLLLLAALLAQAAAKAIPPVTDVVTVTAMGEKNENARADEVYISGFTVDGEEYPTNSKTLKVLEGKWFWGGNSYCWRNETDTRQPEGTTRTVKLAVPVGWERSISFECSEWRGMATVCSGDLTETVDTSESKSARLEKSDSKALLWNQVRRLLVFAAVMLVISGGLILCIMIGKNPSKTEIVRTWVKNQDGLLIELAIACITFILMFYYADRHTLWGDELHSVGFTHGSIAKAIHHCLVGDEVAPPLHLIIQTIWYHFAPYGERWLMLVSIVPTVLAVFFVGRAGELIGGKRTGIIASLLMALNTTVWVNLAYEYRAYPYLMFFSTLSFYEFAKNLYEPSLKNRMLFSVFLTCMALCHYFGMLACAVYCFLEFADRRKRRKETLIPYLLPVGFSLFWLALFVKTTISNGEIAGNTSWQPVPGLAELKSLLRFLTGQVDIVSAGLLLFLTYSVYSAIHSKCFLDSVRDSKENYSMKFSTFYIVFPICAIFLFGHISINHTMWNSRYFVFLVPQIVILFSLGLRRAFLLNREMGRNMERIRTAIPATLCIYLLFNCLTVAAKNSSNQPDWPKAADWLYCQRNTIYNEDTLVLTSYLPTATEGWVEYYLTEQGRRDKVNVTDVYEISKDKLLKYELVYVVRSDGQPEQLLKDDFVLESEDKNCSVKVYVRK